MKNVIVGTSGHVDHGKTCLIKALSGVDTDRLKEEKKRGITIELGFANLDNDEDLRIGIIDVPGHEKFVRNMLAGIGGIDIVLLVIGLDEGVMPQTVEHFEIIKSLNISKGIIVYTKADIAEDGMLELVNQDVDELVKGSFLQNSPRIQVSSYTGQNIDELKKLIFSYANQITSKNNEKELFRLPIDRVFTMEGHGTVVTGTLLEGCVSVNDEVEILPQGTVVKVRQVQSHNSSEQTACAGQRTALNLAGVSKEDLQRGEVLASVGSIILSERIDTEITLFGSTKYRLKNNDHVHINYGSNQTQCRVVLINENEIRAGQSALAQLVFDSPVPVKRADKFIIRFLSPVVTFGGGTVLATGEEKHKRFEPSVIETLEQLRNASDDRLLDTEIAKAGFSLPDTLYLSHKVNFSLSRTEAVVAALYKSGLIIKLNEGNKTHYIHKKLWNELIGYCETVLNAYHKQHEILPGIPKSEFRQTMGSYFRIKDEKSGDLILDALIDRKKICLVEGCVAAVGFAATYSDENRTIREDIENLYKNAGIQIPETNEVISKFKDQNLARQIINDLNKKGALIKINNSYYVYTDFFNSIISFLREWFSKNKTLTLAQFRDKFGTSRKYALLVLEFCDYRGYTKLVGDARISLIK